jgi:hypothetical protein
MPPAIDLARRFAEAITALRAIHDFDDWIGQYWRHPCPAPERVALARADRGGSNAIVWHEGGATIFGFLPDQDGCFCVPRDTDLPDFAFDTGSFAAPYRQDIVISAAMREEIQPPGS